ncbi:hypothetical protein PsYK624_153860 [Phanerochaete sordida]|uniref:Uncharacterized protein n=1 Tax=Phanerochaete sordida TaxID=48140 RepID=A0A9P3GT76_9APHY|nr:hypothetical protein PsYK624_153860 [Phanerochaete sordida]
MAEFKGNVVNREDSLPHGIRPSHDVSSCRIYAINVAAHHLFEDLLILSKTQRAERMKYFVEFTLAHNSYETSRASGPTINYAMLSSEDLELACDYNFGELSVNTDSWDNQPEDFDMDLENAHFPGYPPHSSSPGYIAAEDSDPGDLKDALLESARYQELTNKDFDLPDALNLSGTHKNKKTARQHTLTLKIAERHAKIEALEKYHQEQKKEETAEKNQLYKQASRKHKKEQEIEDGIRLPGGSLPKKRNVSHFCA